MKEYMPDNMQSSIGSKNSILARETSLLRNSIVVPLAEAHRYLNWLGGEFITKSNHIIAMATTLDTIVGDDKSSDYIKENSHLTFANKEFKSLDKIFPHKTMDLSDIEGLFYDVVESVEGLLQKLSTLFVNSQEQLKRVIFLLTDLASKLKKTVHDLALKVYMHTKIEMIMRSQQTLAVAA
jgi:hypothetical protein